jgi:phenylalanyl-tRNA synthetase alpha chain
MSETSAQIKERFTVELGAVADAAALQALRDRFLGRKAGAVTLQLKDLGRLEGEARKQAGQELNGLKGFMEEALAAAATRLSEGAMAERLARERVDLSLPGRVPRMGRVHPLSAIREDLEDIFVSMGYEVYEGREVEDDYHCFEALNMPADHPARDMQDTFYLTGGNGVVLRTHTSSAQIRYMLANPHAPRVRIICPGRVFRRDDDITHSPMFQQIEGLVVGPGIHLGHLKGTIEAFLQAIFGPRLPVRFRPSFFPYTEPSVEADLGCAVCEGKGCRVCKGTGWLEILGSGMVHPAVFEAVNARLGRKVYDPEEITGFAFGLGIERVAMMRHGVDDIRLFYGNYLRFLEQFTR